MPKNNSVAIPESKDRKALRELLPTGYMITLTAETGLTSRNIRYWFDGSINNSVIASEVLKLAKQEKERLEKENAEVKSVLKN